MDNLARVAMTLPPSVQHIKIEINDAEEQDEIEDFASLADWTAAEASWLALPQLKDVLFVASNFESPELGFSLAIKAEIRASLPTLKAQGRLHFTTDGFHPNLDYDYWNLPTFIPNVGSS